MAGATRQPAPIGPALIGIDLGTSAIKVCAFDAPLQRCHRIS
jgi:hypothetical protein